MRNNKTAVNSIPNLATGQTLDLQLIAIHFVGHAADLTIVGLSIPWDIVQTVMDGLLNAHRKEGPDLSGVYSQKQNIANHFSSITVGDVLKILAGTLVF